jgi:hypothetical protein
MFAGDYNLIPVTIDFLISKILQLGEANMPGEAR